MSFSGQIENIAQLSLLEASKKEQKNKRTKQKKNKRTKQKKNKRTKQKKNKRTKQKKNKKTKNFFWSSQYYLLHCSTHVRNLSFSSNGRSRRYLRSKRFRPLSVINSPSI
jgi:hypothetical protein